MEILICLLIKEKEKKNQVNAKIILMNSLT